MELARQQAIMDEYAELIDIIDTKNVENGKLKTLINDLFQICVFECVGQQTSQYDTIFKQVEEVLQNGKS